MAAALTAVWFGVPGSLTGPAGTVLYLSWAAAAAVVALVAVRWSGDRRLWAPAAAAVAALVAGDALWHLSRGADGQSLTGATAAPWDVFYVPAHVALVLTSYRLVRHSRPASGPGALLDVAIVGAGAASLGLPVFLHTARSVLATGDAASQVMYLAQAISDVGVMAAMAVAALSTRYPGPVRLLGCGSAFLLVADQVFVLQVSQGVYRSGGVLDWLWLAAYSVIAAGIVAAARAPAAEPPPESSGGGAGRLVLLGFAALQAPVVLVAASAMPDTADRAWLQTSYGWVTLALVTLVTARVVHLFRENERTTRRLAAALAEGDRLSSDLRHQAEHDAVTGLPNRYALAARAVEFSGSRIAHSVVVLDLDDFKSLNDTHGHVVGDMLLHELGNRLRAVCRPQDVVARLGGDEFAVLLRGVGAEDAVRAARRLLALLAQPVAIAGREIVVGASAGVADLAPGADHQGSALAEADVAMYAAKRAGRNRVLRYTADMRREVLSDTDLVADVVRAIRERSIRPAFQPIVDLESGRTVGLEALARWEDAQRGSVPPGVFIPVALSRGLLAELDLTVMEQALDHLADWRRIAPELRLSVNASADLLSREDLADQLLSRLDEHGLTGTALTVEVTEQAVLDDPARAARALEELRRHGVRIALDDFGTGYSSLSYLGDLPVDVLKIDRSFVAGGVADGRATPLLENVVRLGRDLGFTVLAEGIETAEQHDVLRRLGCRWGQGWLFAAALAPEQVRHALEHPLPAGAP